MSYQIGQEVIVVIDHKNSETGHQFSKGERVRVSSLDSDGFIDCCEYLDGHDYWYIDEDEVMEIPE